MSVQTHVLRCSTTRSTFTEQEFKGLFVVFLYSNKSSVKVKLLELFIQLFFIYNKAKGQLQPDSPYSSAKSKPFTTPSKPGEELNKRPLLDFKHVNPSSSNILILNGSIFIM